MKPFFELPIGGWQSAKKANNGYARKSMWLNGQPWHEQLIVNSWSGCTAFILFPVHPSIRDMCPWESNDRLKAIMECFNASSENSELLSVFVVKFRLNILELVSYSFTKMLRSRIEQLHLDHFLGIDADITCGSLKQNGLISTKYKSTDSSLSIMKGYQLKEK